MNDVLTLVKEGRLSSDGGAGLNEELHSRTSQSVSFDLVGNF